MTAYYNEVDPYAAEWLRNLIAAGAIAPGDVDERDLRDVAPSDLDGYRQCHFFAGIGIWSAALRVAGWDDDRPVWTGSCPCQPFSAAGAGAGFEDERHLWPDWHWLIEQCRPETVFGEQVASADGLGWLDLVSADLEATDYALGAVDTCAAGFRSFHIRQRLYFAAQDQRSADREAWRDVVRAFGGLDHPAGPRHQPQGQGAEGPARDETRLRGSERGRGADRLADSECVEWNGRGAGEALSSSRTIKRAQRRGDAGWLADARSKHLRREPRGRIEPPGTFEGEERKRKRCRADDSRGSADGRVADAAGERCRETGSNSRRSSQRPSDSGSDDLPWFIRDRAALLPDAPDLYWRDADWLFCRDGVWRPVGPGTFPLASKAPARMGRLRAYGNGLDLAQAAGFVRAFLDRDVTETPAIAGDLFEWGT